MKERPIPFSAPEVRAILDGSKTQFRRVVKRQPATVDIEPNFRKHTWGFWGGAHPDHGSVVSSPYGEPGDRLWGRETFATFRDDGDRIKPCASSAADSVVFPTGHQMLRVDQKAKPALICGYEIKWRPSTHMPRWASRITLEVVSVRVERLHDITEEDAKAEGVERVYGRDVPAAMGGGIETWRDYLKSNDWLTSATSSFASLWRSINGSESWAANPWVWVVEFKRGAP